MTLYCTKCSLQFDKNIIFDMHLSIVHKKTIDTQKEKIDKEPDGTRNATVREKKKKPFKCDICGYSFSEKGSLKKHITSVHEGKKPFKCDLCDYSFSRKDNMNNHIASVHKGKKQFKCEICD